VTLDADGWASQFVGYIGRLIADAGTQRTLDDSPRRRSACF
jgi:hypothetical protein